MKITYSSYKSVNPKAYLSKSCRDKEGKLTTYIIETLGTLEQIKARVGCEDPRQWCEEYAIRMTEEENKLKKSLRANGDSSFITFLNEPIFQLASI